MAIGYEKHPHGIDAGKTGVVIHGFKSRLNAGLARLLPNSIVLPVANRVMRPGHLD